MANTDKSVQIDNLAAYLSTIWYHILQYFFKNSVGNERILSLPSYQQASTSIATAYHFLWEPDCDSSTFEYVAISWVMILTCGLISIVVPLTLLIIILCIRPASKQYIVLASSTMKGEGDDSEVPMRKNCNQSDHASMGKKQLLDHNRMALKELLLKGHEHLGNNPHSPVLQDKCPELLLHGCCLDGLLCPMTHMDLKYRQPETAEVTFATHKLLMAEVAINRRILMANHHQLAELKALMMELKSQFQPSKHGAPDTLGHDPSELTLDGTTK